MSHSLKLHTDPVPLVDDGQGGLRVGDSRVYLEDLEDVVREFDAEESPESIAQNLDTLLLRDVYAVLAYYLHHEAEVRSYIAEQRAGADDARRDIEGQHKDRGALRNRLTERWQELKRTDVGTSDR